MFDINREQSSSLSLDELDLQIIEQLKADARQSVRAIARVLGRNRETVRYRLNRLISEDILRVLCVTKYERLGYQFMLIIGIRVRPGCIESVAQELADLPGVIDVSLTGSRYNLMVWALFRDRKELVHFVSKHLAGISNIMSTEIMHSFHTVKDFWLVQTHSMERMNNSSQEPLSNLDLSIIKALQQNPRQTITELASSIGCSRLVARTRLEELVREGIIGFLPIVNTTVRGYSNWVVLLIKAEPDKVNAVVDELSAQDTTWHVSLVTGQWQVYAVALFRDSRQVNDFIAETLSSIPGVTEFEVIPLGRPVKYTFPPDPAPASGLADPTR